jgi:arachidonate 15-lipoxygenase
VRIDSELGTSLPGHANWPLARKIALCAASTHMSLVRHLNWMHLTGGNALAIATRNCLPSTHPLLRLLWPHMYGTQSSNLFTIIGQLVPKGDYEAIFSLTHRGLCRLLEETHDDFDLAQLDPNEDARRRGLLDAHVKLKLPVLKNRQALYRVLHAHASRYLRLYYDSDASLRGDEHFRCWVNALDRLLPRGTRAVLGKSYTLESAAQLIASLIYLETVEHESLGAGLWDYQAWTHVQPVRIYRNGQREPLDVYQRLINATFILHVQRTPLMADFSPLALDLKGADAMSLFRAELRKLQRHTQRLAPAPWRITPRDLEANINA